MISMQYIHSTLLVKQYTLCEFQLRRSPQVKYYMGTILTSPHDNDPKIMTYSMAQEVITSIAGSNYSNKSLQQDEKVHGPRLLYLEVEKMAVIPRQQNFVPPMKPYITSSYLQNQVHFLNIPSSSQCTLHI